MIPTAPGSADITALAGDRIVRELLTGLALKASAGSRLACAPFPRPRGETLSYRGAGVPALAFAIVWLGSGFLLQVLAFKAAVAERSRGCSTTPTGREPVHPVVARVLPLGVLAIEGPWTFGDLWVVLGLVGYGMTFVTGVAFISPQAVASAR